MSRGRASIADIAIPALVAGLYFLATALSLALTRSMSGPATVWPASGVLLAALLRTRTDRIPRLIVFAAVANLAADRAFGGAIVSGAGPATAHMVEPIVAMALLQRGGGSMPSVVMLRDVLRFSTCCTLAALCGALVAWAAFAGGATIFVSWFGMDLLGMLIVTPLALAIAARTRIDGAHGRLHAIVNAILSLTLVATITTALFAQSSYPLLFVPLVVLLVATYRLGRWEPQRASSSSRRSGPS